MTLEFGLLVIRMAPLGPWIVTSIENHAIDEPANLACF
jgi:hypothetical protein